MSDNIIIAAVENETDKNKFIDFAYKFYADLNDKNWVEPLRFDV